MMVCLLPPSFFFFMEPGLPWPSFFCSTCLEDLHQARGCALCETDSIIYLTLQFLCRLCLKPSTCLPCMWPFRLCCPSMPLDVQLVGRQGNGNLSQKNPQEKVRFDGYNLWLVTNKKQIRIGRDGPTLKQKQKPCFFSKSALDPTSSA